MAHTLNVMFVYCAAHNFEITMHSWVFAALTADMDSARTVLDIIYNQSFPMLQYILMNYV